ncbi:MAG: hypothetical protein U9N82_06545 [Thermodesulfobacteriota bacterium]|nr:hypothetical protein [Thermodesulfobacteriota bacterium]
MMEEKLGSHKRALRRHHDKRKKEWVRKTLGHYFTYATDLSARRVGMYSRTPKVCSCFMCGNPRRFHQKPSVQERRAILEVDELISEPAPPLPKTALG